MKKIARVGRHRYALNAAGAAQVPIQDRQPAGSALRPAVMGPTGGVSTGHPLTTAAAFSILLKGGNAFDAGVASLIAGGVLEQDLYSLGGEALVLVYPKKENKVTSIVGQGWAPKAVDVDWYVSRNKTLDGAGLDPPPCRAPCTRRSRCSSSGAR
jgi:gamma-glutamyltranspeptidase/glutathione hydrolase